MKTNLHPECYGHMFPDLDHLKFNQPTEGKAFGIWVANLGIGRQRRELKVKPESWDECIICPEYRTCYDLGMARLALQSALA